VAVLGDLPRQTYTVNWTTSLSRTGPRSLLLSAILAVDALFISVPTISAQESLYSPFCCWLPDGSCFVVD
jgi:hypothetical protein